MRKRRRCKGGYPRSEIPRSKFWGVPRGTLILTPPSKSTEIPPEGEGSVKIHWSSNLYPLPEKKRNGIYFSQFWTPPPHLMCLIFVIKIPVGIKNVK